MPRDIQTIGEGRQGDPNIMKLGDTNKVRPLSRETAEWRQHGIEHPSDPEQFVSMVCPGARSCPLCRKPTSAEGKQHFPVSRRYAMNVWDYGTNSVKVLVAGPTVFDEFKGAAKVGIDPTSCDWTIIKSGGGLNTKYEVIRHDVAPFEASTAALDQLHDVAKYEQTASTEAIFEALEKFGIDYDALSTPQYTYEQALAFIMPYTRKHKGDTIERIVGEDQDWALWLHGEKLEQGSLGDPVFVALQTVLEHRGLVPPLEDALAALPEPDPAAPPSKDEPMPQAKADDVAVAEAGMAKLVGPDGSDVAVPKSAVEHMLKAGFKLPEPETAVDANAPMELLIGGQRVTLPREQALALLESGTAQQVEAEATEPEPPKLPLPDEPVQVTIGSAMVEMPYVEAAKLVDAGSATFADSDVAEAHERVSRAGVEAKAADPTGTPQPEPGSTPEASGSTSAANPSGAAKPFACTCGKSYTKQGGLTQHVNREHGGVMPAPEAVAAATTNGGANGSIQERVKDKIARAPFAKDFNQMLKIFEEATGKRNFPDMTEEDLVKLEARIDQEVAQA